MRAAKKRKLEAKGWTVGDASDFLQLTAKESAFIEMKLKLADAVQKRRKILKLTQTQLASRIESSQSRVAKIEAGDPSVTIDLIVRSLFALGLSQKALAKIIEKERKGRVPA